MNTESTDDTLTPEPAPAPLPSPGSMIREARERAGMSLDDVAAHTKLARATLDALERDDYRALLEPVYVRGYYRKCAKVLEMDEERLISAYRARVAPKTPEAPAKLRLASGTELGSSSRLPVSMAVLAAVVAVVVCAFIWFARDARDTFPSPVALESVPLGDAGPVETVPELQPESDPADSAESASAAAPSDAPIAEPTAPTPQADPAAAAAPGSLRLRFVQTSWVRVDDAGGKTLLNGMRPAGEVDMIAGQPPLSVFLGNAPGVEVEFEGARFDTAAFVRDNNTARFTLPASP